MFLLFFLIRLTSDGPFIFKQKRAGKGKKPFELYKIRTMVVNAEDLKSKYKKYNQADGPVFKIKDDPRYTSLGKFLSHTGLDEMLQLVNIIKGEMDFVGPRPLPLAEAKKVDKKYERRFSVLPGITSPWIVNGAHNLSFKKWMELDLDYAEKKNIFLDLVIMFKTIVLIIGFIKRKIFYKHAEK